MHGVGPAAKTDWIHNGETPGTSLSFLRLRLPLGKWEPNSMLGAFAKTTYSDALWKEQSGTYKLPSLSNLMPDIGDICPF